MRATGVCFLAGDSISTTELHLLKIPARIKGAAHLAHFQRLIETVIGTNPVLYGAIEDGSFGSKGRIFQLGQVNGLAQAALFTREIPYVNAAPGQLKKFFVGSGRAAKEAMLEAASAALGTSVENDNLADAYGLACLARAMHTGVCETEAQEQVLAALHETRDKRVFLSRPTPKKRSV